MSIFVVGDVNDFPRSSPQTIVLQYTAVKKDTVYTDSLTLPPRSKTISEQRVVSRGGLLHKLFHLKNTNLLVIYH